MVDVLVEDADDIVHAETRNQLELVLEDQSVREEEEGDSVEVTEDSVVGNHLVAFAVSQARCGSDSRLHRRDEEGGEEQSARLNGNFGEDRALVVGDGDCVDVVRVGEDGCRVLEVLGEGRLRRGETKDCAKQRFSGSRGKVKGKRVSLTGTAA